MSQYPWIGSAMKMLSTLLNTTPHYQTLLLCLNILAQLIFMQIKHDHKNKVNSQDIKYIVINCCNDGNSYVSDKQIYM